MCCWSDHFLIKQHIVLKENREMFGFGLKFRPVKKTSTSNLNFDLEI